MKISRTGNGAAGRLGFGGLGHLLLCCAIAIRAVVPKLALCLGIGTLSAWLATGSAGIADAADEPWVSGRGINIGACHEVHDLRELDASGFSFVRLAVELESLPLADDAGRPPSIACLGKIARHMPERGLGLIVALKAKSQRNAGPHSAPKRYRDTVRHVAATLGRMGPTVALELGSAMETCTAQTMRDWQDWLTRMTSVVRESAPDLTLIVGGACRGDAKSLVQLDPAVLGDRRLLFSFEFYEPVEFTHQGVGTAGDVKGAPWPGDPVAQPLALILSKHVIGQDETLMRSQWEARVAYVRRYLDRYIGGHWGEARLGARFSEVRAWAERHDIPLRSLILSAFGVTASQTTDKQGGALDADRVRWLEAVKHQAETLGITWVYTDLSLHTSWKPDRVARKALGLDAGSAN